MQHYGEALQRNRCNGAFWHFRGLAATQLNQPQQAVRRYDDLHSMHHHGDCLPTRPWAWYSRTPKVLRAVLQAVLVVCTHGLLILFKRR